MWNFEPLSLCGRKKIHTGTLLKNIRKLNSGFLLLLFLICFYFFSCSSSRHSAKKTEKSGTANNWIDPGDLVLNQFDSNNILLLKRYLTGVGTWDYNSGRGRTYAIKIQDKSKYFNYSKNEFSYYFNDSTDLFKTKVLLSFDKFLSFGDSLNITKVKSESSPFSIKIVPGTKQKKSFVSDLIIEAPFFYIQIFEESSSQERKFTINALKLLNDELKDVLNNLTSIDENGIIPLNNYYPEQSDTFLFEIIKGTQPGIYNIKARFNAIAPGEIFVRLYSNKSKREIGSKIIPHMSTKETGWSKKGQFFFPYQSEITVYDGDGVNPFYAIFRLYFKDRSGMEKMIGEKMLQIESWKR